MDKHADSRDKKARKKRYGMQVSGRSTKTILLIVATKPLKKRRKK